MHYGTGSRARAADAGRVTESRRVVEHGDDVADVRTVPLPGDRVALVTGDDVELLALGESR